MGGNRLFNKKTFNFIATNNISLNADLYTTFEPRKNITIIYLHGGGLLYGTRDDFPLPYLNMFLAAGYDFLALDYPLAPETALTEIIATTLEQILFYLHNTQEILKLPNKDFIFLGRSAGSYLAFMLCQELLAKKLLAPKAFISMYGYENLTEPSFKLPSPYYNKLPHIPELQISNLISAKPKVYAPLAERFSLYVHARQTGKWLDYLQLNGNYEQFALSIDTMHNMPPTVLAAATLDPDVPYRLSKNLSKLLPLAKLLTVYQSEHDFDRNLLDCTGKNIYQAIINWLN